MRISVGEIAAVNFSVDMGNLPILKITSSIAECAGKFFRLITSLAYAPVSVTIITRNYAVHIVCRCAVVLFMIGIVFIVGLVFLLHLSIKCIAMTHVSVPPKVIECCLSEAERKQMMDYTN